MQSKCGDGSYHTLLLHLPYLPRCSLLLFVLIKRSVQHFFYSETHRAYTHQEVVCCGVGARHGWCYWCCCWVHQQICLNFYCTVLFLHTTLEGSSVHTYLPTTNWSTDLLEHGWMKKSCTVVKAKRVTTQINGHVLNAHALSDSAIAFLELCAKLKPPARC